VTRNAIPRYRPHRGYGTCIALAIANPGTFHFGVTPQLLFRPHRSRPWNPIIANVLYRAGIIEQWGTGPLNMLEWCRRMGAPAPTYAEQADAVVVRFLPAPGFARPESQPESRPESLADRVLRLLVDGPCRAPNLPGGSVSARSRGS
jgi:hypothetical protein